ncbi:hypothetical protein QJS10_CPA07g01246 [Acorus calamus]|uniref:Uncharacterized protein n=1 Tax=Acorus calamus TaxID=4465 RepID=A0AAV9EGH2_ACOCL|nr:hypothetical protein QJS10_CPA07g01246 [Acorus calamus]
MKIKKLVPVDPESWRLIDWMEKGDADLVGKVVLGHCAEAVIEEYEAGVGDTDAFGRVEETEEAPGSEEEEACIARVAVEFLLL